MKMILSRLCCLTIFFLFEVSAISAPQPSSIPKHFNAYIGGFMGVSYKVELREGILTYTVWQNPSNQKATTITPAETQWHEFRQTLDELKIWQWRGNYPNKNVKDGTQWSIDIIYADRVLKTKGDNSYPDDAGKPNGKPEPTEVFNRYLSAVQKLMGGKTFR